MKRKTINAAKMTSPDPTQKGRPGLTLYIALPARKAIIPPTPPIKLMMPFAWERFSDGVISGIKATTGVRQNAMARKKDEVQATKKGSIPAMGINPNATAEIGAAMRIKGMRRPILVRTPSDHGP